jgi:simple sugar transport system ATP-binding protein
MDPGELPKSVAAMGISSRPSGLMALFSSHPPIEERIRALDIRPSDPTTPVRSLSGGNQQKVVVARELARGARLLLAAQPTRGVDIGAIETIHAELRKARDGGAAILLVSAELSEILALSDRVAVLYRGRIVSLTTRDAIDAEAIGELMTGAKSATTTASPRAEAT